MITNYHHRLKAIAENAVLGTRGMFWYEQSSELMHELLKFDEFKNLKPNVLDMKVNYCNSTVIDGKSWHLIYMKDLYLEIDSYKSDLEIYIQKVEALYEIELHDSTESFILIISNSNVYSFIGTIQYHHC